MGKATGSVYAEPIVSPAQLISVLSAALGLVVLACGGEDTAPEDTAPDKGLPTRSSGCGTPASESSAEGTTASVGGRTYRYFVPKGYDANEAYPVVYVLHGTGANGQQMSQYIKMQEYVKGKAIVVFPDGAGGKWDTSGDSDLTFFDAMNDDLGGKTCTNPSRVLVTGFSLGGYMTNYLGCHRGAKIRAIAPAAGGFPGKSDECAALSTFVYHKTQDDTVRIAEGQKARDTWKTIDGCSDETEAYGSLGCVSYKGCSAGSGLWWCEDKKQTAYAHDLDADYRVPIWEWFSSLP